jgi:hypothetical protein
MGAEQIELRITPLGAALVEAMPNRKLMRRIQTRFEKNHECPEAKLFSAKEVAAYYRKRGQKVRAVQRSSQPLSRSLDS